MRAWLPNPSSFNSQTSSTSTSNRSAEVPHLVVGAAAKKSAGKRGLRRRIADDLNVREKGPELFLPDALHRLLHQGLLAGQLGAVGQTDGDQLFQGLIEADESDLKVRGLHRLDDGGRIELQDPRQIGACDPPALARRLHELPAAFGLRLGAEDLEVGKQRRRKLPHSVRQLNGAAENIFRSGEIAAGLLDGEIGVGHRQQAVVVRRLQRRVARADDLARGQRLKDRIGDSDDQVRAGPDQKASITRRRDVSGAVLDLPVVANVIGAELKRRQPKQFCEVEFCAGDADSGRGNLHVDGLHVGQLQRGRKIDGQRLVTRRELGIDRRACRRIGDCRRGRQLVWLLLWLLRLFGLGTGPKVGDITGAGRIRRSLILGAGHAVALLRRRTASRRRTARRRKREASLANAVLGV